MADERVLRVFISSTFRDMQGEREELVKRVFPEIRRRCEERGVVWGEIDLRWGVTDEQKAEGAVLPICLAEIERTRPYFIGMLGERYGWVPDEISADLRDREAWLRDDAGRSVTELEVLHGVLNAPQMAGHALFYLRDPAWVETLPADERVTYVEEGAEGRRRLAELKERVRGSGFPVRDYADPRAIGALVRADLLALLDRVFPGERAPSPAEAARLDQRAHAEALLPATLDRRDDLLAIAVAADAEGPGSVVTGSPGSGVSTALAAFARARRAERPGDLVVEHHVAAQRGEASEAALLDHLAGELALALDERPPDDSRTGFAPLLARTAAARRVLLVVDGLHLIESAGGGVAWLPLTLPAGVDVVAGTRPGATGVWLQGRGLSRIDLQLFTSDQREAAAVTFLAASSKALDRALLDRIRTADRLASPRQLRVVLDELRQHGDHFTLGPLLDSLLAQEDLDGLLDVVLDRLERDYELDRPGLVGETLGALAASRTGLSEAELLDLLGDGARQPLSQLQLGAGGLLPEIGGYLRLGNDALARAAVRRYLPDAAPMHLRLAGLFAEERTSPRALDELPWQLLGGRDYDGLARLLADTLFIEAAHARDPSLLLRLWTKLEAESAHRAAATYAGFVRDPASRATSIVTPIVAARGGVRETLALRSAAVEVLRRDDPEDQLPAALANLAAAHMATGQLPEARSALDELDGLIGDGGEPELRIALYQNRGAVLRALGERERALGDLERAEHLARESARPLDVQSAAGERAGILAELGRRDEALAASAGQIEAATVSGDASARMRALVTRGALLMDGGDIAGAAQATGEAEYIARDLGDLEWLAAALTLHVRLRQWENRLDLARPAMEELIEVSERLGRADQAAGIRALLAAVPAAPLQDDLAQLRDRINEAQAMMARGDFNGALAAHGEIEAIAGRLGNQGAIAAAVGDQAVCLYYLGRLPEALPLMLRQIELQRPLGDDIALAKALANTGELQGRLGQPAQGLALIEEAEGLARRAGQAEFAGQIAQLAEQIRRRGS